MPLTLDGSHLIAGNWVDAPGGRTFTGVNPATGAALEPTFDTAGRVQVDAAFAAAQAAFDATRHESGGTWANLLDTIAAELEALGDELLQTAAAETALPAEPRLAGERARTCGQLRLYGQQARDSAWVDAVIDRPIPDRKPLPKPDLRRMQRPIGPVVVFDASNFPLAYGVCGGDTASALATGNPVIARCHPAHPATGRLCAEAVRRALDKCALPQGLFSLIQGKTHELGAMLVQHPLAQAVGFTGSQRGGRAIFDLATQRDRPIPCFAEMGSINPLAILPGALKQRSDEIATGLAASITLGAGQFCTKPGVVFVIAGDEADRFVGALARQIEQAPGYTMLYEQIRANYERGTSAVAKTPTVRTHVAAKCAPPTQADAALYEVDSAQWRKDETLRHEVFGPAAIVVRCADLDDLCATLPAAGGNLTGTVHHGKGDDQAHVQRVADIIERHVGRLIHNGYPTGVEVCHAMVHGGPYPSTTAADSTSVGTLALRRFTRPVCYQSTPQNLLPPALRDGNPLAILRIIDGVPTRDPV